MKMNLNTAVAALAMSVAIVAAPMAQAESQEPIKIAVNEWTGQHLSANIAAELLKKMGYTVEMVTAGGLPQFTALEQGELHLSLIHISEPTRPY